MRRKIYNRILEWKNKKIRKPLLIMGARQVGKTYTITEFCKNEYKNMVTFNLLEEVTIVELFKEKIPTEEKYKALKAYLGLEIDIESQDTIIFFDEIQESEELISSLKFFNEKHPEVNIIGAGSLLGVKLKRYSLSFPVGKVEMINMYPMNFEEFLLAFDQDLLIEEIRDSYQTNKALADNLHNLALVFFRYFLCVGGMPDSVKSLVESDRDLGKYDNDILNNIRNAYFNDMSRYIANKSEGLKIENLYKSVPGQLSNESSKFQFSKIERNARKRDYETALDWLIASRLLLRSEKVKTPKIPLKAYVDNSCFKLFMSDVGLLREALGLKFKDILIDSISSYKGVITENYVANELASKEIALYYWSSQGIAEMDFLLYSNMGIIPIEAKSSEAVKSKSLKVYMEKFQPEYSIRISTRNFGLTKGIKSVPLYAVFCINEE